MYRKNKEKKISKEKKKDGQQKKIIFPNSQQEARRMLSFKWENWGDGKKVLAISAIIENTLLPAVYLLTTAFIL